MFTEVDYASLPDRLCWVIVAIKNHNTPFHSAISLIACKLCVRNARARACAWQWQQQKKKTWMCLHDATSADEALLFSLRRNFLLGQHEQAAQRSPSLLVLFDEWKKVFYTSESQGFPFNYFQQNEYKVGCLNSKTTPSWTTQWGGIIFISGRWNQPWGTSGLISLDPERRIWMFVFIHMHNFSRRSQWQKKKVAKSTIFTPMTEAGVWKWFLCFVIL